MSSEIESDALPAYRTQGRGLRLVGTVILLFVFGGPIVWQLGSMLSHWGFLQRADPVTIENRTASVFIAWGTTESTGEATGDATLSPTFGFVIKPHATVMLPHDRVWVSVAIYSSACDLIAEETPDGPSRIVIEGVAVTIEPAEPIGNPPVADSTTECTLLPYEGRTPKPL